MTTDCTDLAAIFDGTLGCTSVEAIDLLSIGFTLSSASKPLASLLNKFNVSMAASVHFRSASASTISTKE